jgi:hypothetical protein
MYTPHPVESRLTAFVPRSLVRAAENDVSIAFHEILGMRRVVAQIASDLEVAQPDLIPFFATGGIPFIFPTMHALADKAAYSLLDGRHFHMFPGLSWDGKLDGVDSESFFAGEFGRLIADATPEKGKLRIWTMDATFTGNAVWKLLKALHRACHELTTRPPKVSVSLLAIIDASRASREAMEDDIPLESPFGTLYLKRPAVYSPTQAMGHGQPVSFVRDTGDDLFDLTIEFRVVSAIPTEDRAELIGSVAKKNCLGVASNHEVGRLTVTFDNGRTVSGTGGNGIGNNILAWLSKTEDSLPWNKWLEAAALQPPGEDEKESYEEATSSTLDGLRMFELIFEPTETVVEGLTSKSGLLDGAEVYCLKHHAIRQFRENGSVDPTCFTGKLLRKVLASAKAHNELAADALMLFRVCRRDMASDELDQHTEGEMLKWWDKQLERN